MFHVAIFIGVYSYIIFLLGVCGLLYKEIILGITGIYALGCAGYVFKSNRVYWMDKIKKIRFKGRLVYSVTLLMAQMLVNLVGALGPEHAYDALWYHLTLPKLYLQAHSIQFIPGGLLYYSAMPKLTEMLYLAALVFQGEILAKFIHFLFGLCIVISLYAFSRRYFTQLISLMVCLVFYSNLVVAWESITAYVDLARGFYEFLALWAFIMWWKKEKTSWLILSALLLGFAIAVKLIAFGSLGIFTLLIIGKYVKIPHFDKSRFETTREGSKTVSNILIYWTVAIGVVLPWMIFAYIHTGNPFYPIFSGYSLAIPGDIFSPLRFIKDIVTVLLFADDPISPIYMLSMPLIVFLYRKMRSEMKIMVLYAAFALVIWYFTPRTGGGRFLLPYLPAFSVLLGEVITRYRNKKVIYNTLVIGILVISILTIAYRAAANRRYLPVIIGRQSKEEFLMKNLNFSFGDYYDLTRGISTRIHASDKVLLYGFHNLFYIDFPFIDNSWVKKGDIFTHVATQNTSLPERFRGWKVVYRQKETGVVLYTNGKKEVY